MKRLFACMLAIFMLVFPGCNQDTTAEDDTSQEPQAEEILAARYFFYEQEGNLYCLDTKTQTSHSVPVSMNPSDTVSAKLSKNGKTIIFLAGESLYKWNLGADKATLIDTGVNSCSANETMDTLLYTKGENEMYLHSKKHGSSKISTLSSPRFSLQQNGNNVIMEDVDSSQMGSTDVYSEIPSILYKVEADGSKTALTKIIYHSLAASADHSVICYLKKEGEPTGTLPRSWPAYRWTSSGEKKLPFSAAHLTVFGPNEIYYVHTDDDGNRMSYYYDGKESHLLTDRSGSRGFKVGNHFYVCDVRYKGLLVAHKGKTICIPNAQYDLTKGMMGGISTDGNTLYVWAKGNLYAVFIEGGALTYKLVANSVDYTPRYMTLQGGNLLNSREGLFLNDVQISNNATSSAFSLDGKSIAYLENNTLYRYTDGQVTKISENIQGDAFPLEDGNVLFCKEWQTETAGTLCLNNGTKETVIGENIRLLDVVYPWSTSEYGNIVVNGRQNSWIGYNLYIQDLITQ